MSDLYEYGITILIIIIISLGEILLSYITNTSHKNTRTHAHARTPPSPFRLYASVAPQRDEVNAPLSPVPLAFMGGSWVTQINTRAGDPISPRCWMFFAYKKNCMAELRRELVTGCTVR